MTEYDKLVEKVGSEKWGLLNILEGMEQAILRKSILEEKYRELINSYKEGEASDISLVRRREMDRISFKMRDELNIQFELKIKWKKKSEEYWSLGVIIWG